MGRFFTGGEYVGCVRKCDGVRKGITKELLRTESKGRESQKVWHADREKGSDKKKS